MIIDAHQHFWQYDPSIHSWISDEMQTLKKDFMPPNLKKEMDKVHIDGCVSIQANQTEQETAFLLQLAEKYNFIKGVIGWLDLRADNIEDKLHHYSQIQAFKGVRHVVQDEPNDRFLLRPDFLRGVGKLSAYNLSYDILIFSKHLPVAVEFASKFPDQKFVLDHIAKPNIKDQKIKDWEEGIRILAQHPNMYCKVSGMVTEADWQNWDPENFKPYLDVIFEAFGPQKILFGSDWPVCTLAGSYRQVYNIIQNYISPLNQADQNKIMGVNAKKIYNL